MESPSVHSPGIIEEVIVVLQGFGLCVIVTSAASCFCRRLEYNASSHIYCMES